MKLIFVFLTIILIVTTTCCTSKRYDIDLPVYSAVPVSFDYENKSAGRFKTLYIAQQLFENLKDKKFVQGGNKIGVLPFVNLENFNQTTSFGQFIGEQLIFELTGVGFNLLEIRSSDSLCLANRVGEFFLHRSLLSQNRTVKSKDLINDYGLDGLVAGTYIINEKKIYLNARLIELSYFFYAATRV